MAKQAQALGNFGIVGRDRPAVAESTQVLARIEAPGDGVAMPADPAAFVPRAMSLCGVFD